jgi:hypothetical protein
MGCEDFFVVLANDCAVQAVLAENEEMPKATELEEVA